MSTLIQANPTDSLQADCENIVFRIHHPDTSWMGKLLQSQVNYQDILIWTYRPISNLIVEWTDYYWRISSSEKEIHKRCLDWLEYACKANPYNPETVVKAAPLLVRLKEKKQPEPMSEKRSVRCKPSVTTTKKTYVNCRASWMISKTINYKQFRIAKTNETAPTYHLHRIAEGG